MSEPPDGTSATRRANLLMPWSAAGAIYGPYGVSDFRQPTRREEVEPEVEIHVDDPLGTRISLDPLLRTLVPVRLWVGLGAIVFVIKLRAHPDISDRLEDAWLHGGVTMVLGPYGVLLAVLALLLVAGHGHRLAALRRNRRSTAIALVTVLLSVGVFGLQLPFLRRPVERAIDALTPEGPGGLGILFGLAGTVVTPWLFIFGVCSVYLMHRNGFSTHADPYLRPLVTSWLACMVAAVELTAGSREGLSDTDFVLATLAGPVVTIILSVGEVLRLRRLGVRVGGQNQGGQNEDGQL